MKKALQKLLFAAMLVSWTTHAQNLSDYTFRTGVDSTMWIPLTSSAVELIGNSVDDQASPLLNIGFNFILGEDVYSQFSVNSNGTMRLGSQVVPANNCGTFFYSNYNVAMPKISGVAMDIGTGANGYVKYEIHGGPPHRILVAEYKMARNHSLSSVADVMWQVQLHEDSNKVVLVYGPTAPSSIVSGYQTGWGISSTDFCIIHPTTHSAILRNSYYGTSFSAWHGANRYYEFVRNELSCPNTFRLLAQNITESSVELSWLQAGGVMNYTVEYGPAGFTQGAGTRITVYDTAYQLTELLSNTLYDVYIYTNCDAYEMSRGKKISFRTLCDNLKLPYIETFDSYGTGNGVIPDCWTRLSANNYPMCSGNVSFSRPSSLYFSSNETAHSAVILPEIDTQRYSIASLELSFSYLALANHCSIVVGLLTDSLDVANIIPIDTVSPLVSHTRYRHTVSFEGYSGDATRIVLLCAGGADNSMYIDDLMLQEVNASCPAPYNANVLDISSSDITIEWSDSVHIASHYVVKWSSVNNILAATDSAIVNTTNYVISHLPSNTDYYIWVQAVCDEEQQSAWLVFPKCCTACPPYPHDSLPYVQNFASWGDGYSSAAAIDPCWKRYTNYSVNSPYKQTLLNDYISMNFTKGNNAHYSYLVLPQFEDSVNTLQLKFMMKNSLASYNTNLEVGVMVNPYDVNTFTTVASVVPSIRGEWQEMIVNLNTYQGEGKYITIMAPYSSGTSESYVSNVMVSLIPQCSVPDSVAVSLVEVSSAFVSWKPVEGINGYPASYELEITKEGQSPNVMTTNERYIMLSGLDNNSNYRVRVRSVCGGSSVSDWTDTVCFTTKMCYSLNFAAYNNVYIGDSSIFDLRNDFPLRSGTDYSYTQQIFDANELHGSRVILGIGFYYRQTWSISSKNNVSIYLGHTSDSVFADVNSLIPLDSLKLLYTGNLNCRDGLNVFHFDDAFLYNGVDNLVLAIDDNSDARGTYDDFFKGHPTGVEYKSICYYNDYVNPDPANPSSFNEYKSRVNHRCNVLLLGGNCDNNPDCVAPSVAVVDSQSSSLKIVWVPGYDETQWILEYKRAADTTWTYVGLIQGVNTYTITSLSPTTKYDIKLSSNCSQGSAYAVVSASTTCGAINSLPWIETFNDTDTAAVVNAPRCWTTYSSFSYNYPYIASENYDDGSLPLGSNPASLYMYSYDNVNTVGYTYAVLPQVNTNIYSMDTLSVKFQMYKNTTVYPEFSIIVGVMSDPNNIETFEPVDTVYVQQAGRWFDAEVFLRNYSGNGSYIAFLSKRISLDSPEYNYPFIDNVVVDVIGECSRPGNVTIENITDISMDISWTDYSSSSWIVEYGPYGYTHGSSEATTITTTNTSLTLTGLAQNTVYDVYVKGVCRLGGATEWSPVAVFRTMCGAISNLPWTEDFDSYGFGVGVVHPCFSSASTYSNIYPYIDSISAGANIGGSMRMYCSDSYNVVDYTYFAIAELDSGINMSSIQLGFKAYQDTNYRSNIIVGVMANPMDVTSFEAVDTIICNNEARWDYYEVPFSSYSGQGRYIAFMTKLMEASEVETFLIDDIVLDVMPSCPKPYDVVSLGSHSDSIIVDWQELGAATEWQLCFGVAPINPSLGQGTIVSGVTSHPYVFDNLSNDTIYNVYVRSICGPGDTSDWSLSYVECSPGYYNFQTSGTDTVYMCNGWIYDNGGLTGDYSSRVNSTLIVYPSSENSLVYITGSYETVGGGDRITVYDGVGTMSTTRIYQSDMSASNLIFASTTGPLTINFYTGSANNSSGFAFNVQCVSGSCSMVQDIEAVYATSSSATIGWTELGSASSWQIEYGLSGFELGTGINMFTTSNPCVITNLLELTHYDIYVRSICSPGDTSGWQRSTFRTGTCEIPDYITVGTSTTSSNQFPLRTNRNYSYSQQIFLSSELDTLQGGEEMNITAIFFQEAYVMNLTPRNIKIYMGHTRESVFLQRNLWIPISQLQLVFDGEVTFGGTGSYRWREILLDSMFAYNGVDNIVVAVLDETGRELGSVNVCNHSTGNSIRGLSYESDDPISLANLGYGFSYQYRGNIKFQNCINTCNRLDSLTLDVRTNAVEISWDDYVDSEVSYKETSSTEWTEPIFVPDNSHYLLTGLLPGTDYNLRIRRVCDSNAFSYWDYRNITMLSLPCYSPINICAEDVEMTSATIRWVDTSSSHEAWDVAYGYGNSSTNWDTMRVTTPFANLTRLYSNNDYTIRLKPYCSVAGNVSGSWTEPFYFRTVTCEMVRNLMAADVTKNTITLAWSALPEQTKWEISYGLEGVNEDNGTKIEVEGSRGYTIIGLEPDTVYDIYVRSVCQERVYSAWTDKLQVRTSPIGISTAETDNVDVIIYPNPTDGETTVAINGIVGNAEFELADMNGRIIIAETVNCEGSLVKTINVSSLAKGTYFVHIYNNDFNTTRKLIVK